MNLALPVIVFISGAAVLAVEILGTRILGPFYGVSLYLWSALITVTLLALSIGYGVGGRWADRAPLYSRLSALLAAAGVWLLVIPWLRTPLFAGVESIGLRAGVLLVALVLFGPPLTLLGMVTPFAIRLRAKRVEEIGKTAGDLFAISTVASVLSALATGFWLIPSVGVMRLTQSIGLALLIAAAIAWIAGSRERAGARSRVGPAAILLALIVVGALVLAGAERFRTDPAIVAVRESPYTEIRVIDRDSRRFLLLDGGIHTVVDPASGATYFPYVPVVDLAKLFFDEPGRLLVVGLGGGSIVHSFHEDGWSVDAVEIDPSVIEVARDHFGLRPEQSRIHTTDGRRFFQQTDETYDLAVLDAFGSGSIPFHLVSREAFALVANRLAPGGVVALNIEALGWQDPLVAAIAQTLRTSFSDVIALPIAEPPDQVGNLVILAANRRLEFSEDRLGRPALFLGDDFLHWCSVQKNHAWANRFVPDLRGAPVLTDDLNPIDVLTEPASVAARKSLHANPSLRGVAW